VNKQELFENILRKRSYLCVGLDTDPRKIPSYLQKEEDPVFEFNRRIIDATKEYCVAYKPNIAFYESLGPRGWVSLQKTLEYIPEDVFTIADAKRGDIGNTSEMYARTYFETYSFDSVTVAPYMGEDSVTPFTGFAGKWVILLALTSNKGAFDFQFSESAETGRKLYEQVILTSQKWGNSDNIMFVVGATRADMLKEVRQLAPDSFFLVPGVGAQGGSLEEVSKYGMNRTCGLIVNSSRNIIYASSGEDFSERARDEASKIQKEMDILLEKYLPH
jgi:orotidine-5'-phosphate decarboxylase